MELLGFLAAIIGAIIAIIPGTLALYKTGQVDKNLEKDLLIGVAHWAIVSESKECLERGYITTAELESFHVLLKPYLAIGGNGLAIKLAEDLNDLPTKKPE